MDLSGFAAVVIGILGSGGLGAIVAFRKAKPETESIIAGTLKTVIEEVQSERNYYKGIADGLREEIASKDRLLAEAYAQIGDLRGRVQRLEDGAHTP